MGGGRRPVKVWNSGRTIRKALVVSTYEEFQRKGREKLGLSSEEPISVVLEGDGTQVRIKIENHKYIGCKYGWPHTYIQSRHITLNVELLMTRGKSLLEMWATTFLSD